MHDTDFFLDLALKGIEAWNHWRLGSPQEEVNFRGVDFTAAGREGISFAAFHFGENANFKGATFGEGVSFADAQIGNKTNFDGAIFNGDVDFSGPGAFGSLSFSGARFHGSAIFSGRTFDGEVNFSDARFDHPPDFHGTQKRENLDWTGTKFKFTGWTTESETVTRLRRLRGIAKEIRAIDAERDLFILERQAERGVLWRNSFDAEKGTKFINFWRAMTATLVMFPYWMFSNYGRSASVTGTWLIVGNFGFYYLYVCLVARPVCLISEKAQLISKATSDLFFANMLPFVATSRPAFKSAIKILFGQDGTDPSGYPLANTMGFGIAWHHQSCTAVFNRLSASQSFQNQIIS